MKSRKVNEICSVSLIQAYTLVAELISNNDIYTANKILNIISNTMKENEEYHKTTKDIKIPYIYLKTKDKYD